MKQLLVGFLVLIAQLLAAQSYQIEGTVKDKDGNPLEFVNVFLLQDTLIVTGALSDEEGKFSFKASAGDYTLRATHIYLEKFETPLSVQADMTDISVLLQEQSVELSEVVVTDFRNVTEAGIDKKVIHVSDELKKMNTNLSEILEMVSLVNMDMEGTPTIPGKEGVVVLVDSRPPRVRANDLATVLRLIPSDQILRIEIMTNPPAKYTKGNSAVINVVTNRKPQTGSLINGWGNANTYKGAGIGANYTLKRNAWSFSTWGGRWNWISKSKGSFERINFDQDDIYRIKEKNTGDYFGHGYFFGLAPEYKLNEKNIFSMSTGFYTWNNDNQEEDNVNIFNPQDAIFDSFSRSTESIWQGFGGYLGLEYFRYFDEKEKELTISFETGPNNRESDRNQMIEDDINFLQLIRDQENSWNIEGEMEFFDPIDSMSSMNYAAEYSHTLPYNEFTSYYSGSNSENLEQDERLSYHNTISEINQESSISYARKFKKFGINVDLGQQWIHYDILFDQQKEVNNDYHFLIPKISTNFKPLKGLEMGLSYKYAQEAPNIYSLNPNIRLSADRLNSWFGNPDLDAVKSHNVELNSGFYLGKFNIGLTGFWRTSNNAVVQFSRVTNEGVRERTYENNGDFTRTGLDMSVSGSIQKWAKLDFNASVFNSRLNESIGTNQQIISYNGKIQASFFLPKQWSLRLSTRYTGPELDIQGTNRSFYIVRASLKKSFLKGKLNLTLNFDDILRSSIRGGEWSDPAFTINSEYQRLRPYAGLRINYRWGELKDLPKSTKAGKQQ